MLGALAWLCAMAAAAQAFSDHLPVITPLTLTSADIRIENSNDGGYVLFVRAKPEVKSILITESTEPGDHKVATYAMRSPTPHPFNNDQKRMLDGKPVDQPGLYFLVSSTPIPDKAFGQAFRLYLPYVIEFGYPETRHGQIQLVNQAFLSIRSFAKPWADYSGVYLDNPYKLVLTQLPPVVDSGAYNHEAFAVFERIAIDTGVRLHEAHGEKDIAATMSEVLNGLPPADIDLVLCLDATASMQPYQAFIRKELVPLLQGFLLGHQRSRFALVEYRDYFEEFVYRTSQFTDDFGLFQRAADRYRPLAGGDVPEAVDEALMGAMTDLSWRSARRVIVLVGDAPPHPIPQGKITHGLVVEKARAMGITIVPVILPSDGKSALPSAAQ